MLIKRDKMKHLIKQIKNLEKSEVKKIVQSRLKEFSSFKNKKNEEWFSELCFCILTANSKAKTALAIQEELGPEGFCGHTKTGIKKCIIKHKHRFHNNKTSYIIEARKFMKIKEIIQKQKEPREWLVKNIKGLGYKESSHFLRNVGYFNYAILDRHILNLMDAEGYIERPKNLTKKDYLEIEKIFNKIAKSLDMNSAELDLYMWYIKTGEILK